MPVAKKEGHYPIATAISHIIFWGGTAAIVGSLIPPIYHSFVHAAATATQPSVAANALEQRISAFDRAVNQASRVILDNMIKRENPSPIIMPIGTFGKFWVLPARLGVQKCLTVLAPENVRPLDAMIKRSGIPADSTGFGCDGQVHPINSVDAHSPEAPSSRPVGYGAKEYKPLPPPYVIHYVPRGITP